MKRTPLHKEHLSAGAIMRDFAGWEMPVQYTSIIEEHMAVRTACGIFDVSHMGNIIIRGEDAANVMDRLTTNDVATASTGKCVYSHILDDEGHILDDVIATPIADGEFLVVPNAASTGKVMDWIRSHSSGQHLTNISDEIAIIAVQGPTAASVMAELTTTDLDGIGSFHGAFVMLDALKWTSPPSGPLLGDRLYSGNLGEGVPAFLSRTGYTGEVGFEIACENAAAVSVWRALLSQGAGHGLQPVGLGARDTLRLEKGFLLSGTDFDGTQTSLQTGPNWVVKYGHDFIGKKALERQRSAGGYARLVGMSMLGRGIPRHGYDVVSGTDTVGRITSGTMSPVLKKGIALGYVSHNFSEVGTSVRVRVRSALVDAEVVQTPFIRRGQN
ncbi:MAG: glycine cleavage system protein T [Methanobacteriota archaeon]|nr:MAG: glycine cleavage system protein T [Euryarchaeota archaeon]